MRASMHRIRDPLASLFSIPTVPKQKWIALTIGFVTLVSTLVVIPYASTPLWGVTPFFPIFIAWNMFGDFMTSHLLYIQYRATGYKPILILSGTFFFTGLIMIPHLLTFPGIFSDKGVLYAGSRASVWFWGCWHAGFPAGILLYTFSIQKESYSRSEHKNKTAASTVMFIVVVLVVGMITYILAGQHEWLPTLISDSSQGLLLSTGIGPIVWVISLVACMYLYVVTRGRSLLHLWLLLSVFTFFLDVSITLLANDRYTLGWYVACVNSLLSATVVLFVFFYQMNQLNVKLHHSQRALHNSQEQIAIILDSITDAFLAVDKQWCYTYMNKEAEKYLGFSFEVVKGRSIWDINPHLKQTKLYEVCHQVMERGEPAEITEFDQLHGRWLEHRVFPSRNGVSVYFHDVTERIVAEEQMKEANKKLQMANRLLTDFSYTDGLTGVYNRRYFDQMMNQEWERVKLQKSPLSLIMLDVDYFKKYNDTYGHLAGDECLRRVAQAVQNAVTPPLAVVSRYGGEEFGVILPMTDLRQAEAIGEQIRLHVESLKVPHAGSEVSLVVTCSLGVASCSIEDIQDSEPNTLVAMADQKLYRAKQSGRNRLVAVD
ncbi:PAS domain S-box-containing protein/diguanylate cyclase (GGDEF) domain-containing protein [Paenibacillus sp. cl6col]|nr:PAS domain S-box-containing protein/diguanylate cyclase (GGDEF) domain-containing protein [Paenibacillus sp. cl6col]